MPDIVPIIPAILLPPVAAFLLVKLTLHVAPNIVLTLPGGLPGIIHALWPVLTDKKA